MEKIVSYIPLNWELLRNPVNWVFVFLMIALAGVGLALIMQQFTASNVTSNGEVE